MINVRCLDILDIPVAVIVVTASIIAALAAGITLYVFRYKLFIKHRPKDGYEKVD